MFYRKKFIHLSILSASSRPVIGFSISVSGSISELSSINVEEMGTVGRLFGALISKAGIPVPTEITQKVDIMDHGMAWMNIENACL